MVTAGGQYTLECTIRREATLHPSTLLEVMWLDLNNDTITAGPAHNLSGPASTMETSLNSTLTLPRLTTSQAGRYSCVANMTIPDITTDHQVMAQATVTVASEYLTLPLSSPSLHLTCPPSLPLQSPLPPPSEWASAGRALSMWGPQSASCAMSQWILC